MNALVLYVGTEAIAFIRKKGLSPNMSTIAHSAHMDIFQNLAVDLDTEGENPVVVHKVYLFLKGCKLCIYVHNKNNKKINLIQRAPYNLTST